MRSSKRPLSLVILLTCQLLLLFLIRQGRGEESHCTSVAGMVKLLDQEAQLIDNLEDYAVELEKKLETVRRWDYLN